LVPYDIAFLRYEHARRHSLDLFEQTYAWMQQCRYSDGLNSGIFADRTIVLDGRPAWAVFAVVVHGRRPQSSEN
jgi:hypothetical protein